MEAESPSFIKFRAWLLENGAYIHPSLRFGTSKYGSSVFASDDIQKDAMTVSCPFDLIITSKYARDALRRLSRTSVSNLPLDDRDVICSYLVLHSYYLESGLDAAKEDDLSSVFIHGPYINTLPSNVNTPLFFSENELRLLRGTNLFLATVDRRERWTESWIICKKWVEENVQGISCAFSLSRFLLAQTWISSRCFPSSLLADPPSLSSPNALPVMIPLVDAFNHERAKPVSWSIDTPNSKPTSLSLIFHTASPSGSELYNNYGAKPNDELLLGYGFTIPDNPDDALLLKLPGSERRFRIGRRASGESMAVWHEIGRRLQQEFATDGDDLDVMMTELELEIGQILPEMIRGLRSKLPAIVDRDASEPLPGVRGEVYGMIRQYVKGQCDILDDFSDFVNKRLEAALCRASELGIDVSLEPEDDDDDE